MPDSTIDIELPIETWDIIHKLATERGVSTNKLIIEIAMENAREVLGEHLV